MEENGLSSRETSRVLLETNDTAANHCAMMSHRLGKLSGRLELALSTYDINNFSYPFVRD
jgi:hypothetical protein